MPHTRPPAPAGPIALVSTIVVSFVVGWAYLMAITFSIAVRAPLFMHRLTLAAVLTISGWHPPSKV